jgi:hypothetical protein
MPRELKTLQRCVCLTAIIIIQALAKCVCRAFLMFFKKTNDVKLQIIHRQYCSFISDDERIMFVSYLLINKKNCHCVIHESICSRDS